MSSHRRPLSLAIIPALAVLLATAALQASPQATTPSKPAAEVNGQPITEEEIDKAIAGQLAKLQEQIYNLRQQRVEAAIRDRLLAQEATRRGLSVQKLIDAEVTSKVGLVTEEEVKRNGTPAFFINGELLSEAQPLESFARVVDRELARAR